ncbi:serine/threonine-protein kinase [Mycobacterium sp. Z3061]|uniref:serine/threonine-protein kinase n=1 Tax=Mycobacterium sp. Z3061 TaxID=3073562 RepID=UPI002872CBAA|nr:serine/threonine-protein kinase [Mycobacterium sp. Z3061]
METAQTPPGSLAEGTPFGRYRLIELLGRGGMGAVWRAYDTVMDRTVALKVLPEEFANDDVYQERFRREAHAAAGLDEPHVVPIYDFGQIEGRLFVTMRLIRGRDLHSMLADGPLPPARALAIIDQIASALHAAHRIGLVHRDVKPSNILVAEHDFAYLIDFGIARAVGETSLTRAGTVIGTWAYMAPERISTGQNDPRGDIYALACVLYECLTGRPPFPGKSIEQQITAHLTMSPPKPSMMHAGLPPQLDQVIATGMAKDPGQRYATTLELASAAKDAITTPALRPNPSPAAPTMAAPHVVLNTELQRPPAGVIGDAAPTQLGSPSAPSHPGLPVQPPEGPPPPAGARRRGFSTRGKAAIGLGAAAVLAAVIVTTAVIAGRNGAGKHSGVEASTPGSGSTSSVSNPPVTTPPTSSSTEPTETTMSLSGSWSGPVSGDQSGFDVTADIVDGAQLTGTVSYPQLGCAGTWTQHGVGDNGARLISERITRGKCVPAEVTLTPRNDGTLSYMSTYYAASQHRNFTIYATMRRSAIG